jgi:hypothetical protein
MDEVHGTMEGEAKMYGQKSQKSRMAQYRV